MSKVREIFNQFRMHSVQKGEELYLPRHDALGLIDACTKGDVAVIGLEGFVVQDDTLRPRMDLIAECQDDGTETWSQFVISCNEFCIKFLESVREEGVLFAATMMDESDRIANVR